MKSIRFLRHVISLLLLAIVFPLMACGPFYPLIPTPDFFGISGSSGHTSDFERQDNLLLWQKLTSPDIPLADIEQAVYRDSYERFAEKLECMSLRGDNLFYTYITNTGDEEISDLLLLAKELEERRNELTSPWYYPSERRSCDDTDLFGNIQERIESYKSYRLKDRYALQMVRLLFASRRYSECATFTDSVFSAFPDDNLMKRMARKYEAGCWKRMGCSERADTVFAKSGDIRSISMSDRIPLMVSLNPGAPQLVEYIRENASDTLFMLEIDKIAPGVLKDRRVKNKGDWYFTLAYIADTYKNNISDSRRYIYKAMRENFSSSELKSLARTYKMKIDARMGDMMSLHSDLAWLEAKTSPLNPEADKWIRFLQNIIYQDWVPGLWKRGDRTTAILLSAYADNIGNGARRDYAVVGEIPYGYDDIYGSITVDEMRKSDRYFNFADYSSLSFQLMGILSSAELAAVYNRIFTNNGPLYIYLRRLIRQDSDFYNELIGTLALREENYIRAENYLSKVSDRYMRTTNIDKRGYLSRDPFVYYPSRWDVYSFGEFSEDYEIGAARHHRKSNPKAKLDFARKMKAYRNTIEHGKSADERGLARLMYAIGRYNSFEECWALTQYWRGWVSRFKPDLDYWSEDNEDYKFLEIYEEITDHHRSEEIYKRETAAALAMLRTDEAKAWAHYILGNLKTIISLYPRTTTAHHVKTSCDRWRTWL